MRVLDLFSGIGMYALGMEQAGHEVIGFCEKQEWARKILKKHWPTKPISLCIKSLNKALTASLAASPARISVQPTLPAGQGGVRDLPAASRDSSGRWLKPFAWFDPDTLCWRTWQRCLQQNGSLTWEQYSQPWPPAGMISNGIAWGREPLERPTIAPEHTFLPTILATECKGVSRKRFVGSPNTLNTRTAEPFRTSFDCPTILNPSFGEKLMGLPVGYTALEMEIPHA